MKHETDLKIVFIGTPEFGALVLEKLVENNLKPILVVTAPDKPVGRKQILTPPPVKILTEKYQIPILQPEQILNSKVEIRNSNPNLIIVASYSQILPKEILEIPKYGCLNLHPSLLPCWRGPSPIQYTILAGDEETGVTIILMDEKMDHGPILANRKLLIANRKITYDKLLKELANLGGELLIETIPKWIKGEIKAVPQNESRATYSKILKREDGKIDWSKSAQEIERQIRAFNPWPGSYCLWPQKDKERKLKILKARASIQKNYGPFGIRGKTFLAPNDEIAAQTKKDFLIIEELQLEGKKPTTSEEFLRGYQEFIGTILE